MFDKKNIIFISNVNVKTSMLQKKMLFVTTIEL